MKIQRFPVGELSTNSYLLTAGTDEAALVDPGGISSALLDALKNVSLKLILLTHGHYDHIAGVKKLLILYPDVQVIIHEADEIMLRAPECNFSREICGHPFVTRADKTVKEGDSITLGELTLRVMHTPGHSLGSVCYCLEDAIFCGDTIFQGSAGRTDLYGGDEQALFTSLARLKMLEGDRRLLPGHGSETSLAYERATNWFLRR